MSDISRIVLALLFLPIIFSCTGQETADRTVVAADNPDRQDSSGEVDQGTDEPLYEPMTSSREEMLAAAEEAEPLSADAGTVGSTIHSFALKTYDGEVLTSEELRGSVTMLIFWFPT